MRRPVEGDRVLLSKTFLRSCGIWQYEVANREGTVLLVTDRGPGVATVQWDGDEGPTKVLVPNLVCADELHKEPM